MNMNKTREAIIEIIEPFMDKSLSEGCLFKNKISWKIIGYKNINNQIKDKNKVILDRTDLIKILWHYDITAVFKYIEEYMREIENVIPETITRKKIIFEYINSDKTDTQVIEILNKPLHLYTEQEEKDLLKLLKQLWQ